LTARYNMTLRRLGLVAVAAVAVPGALSAQTTRPIGGGSNYNRAPEKNASQIMITSFKTNDTVKGEKGTSWIAAEEMRRKVDGAFPYKQVYVIPVERINPNLEASGFSTTEPLETHDAKQLATQLRADEYVQGVANKTAAGYRVTADLVLTRDINARQPLGVGEAPKLGDALNLVVKEMKEARKQIDGEKKCVAAVRDQKLTEAIAFAKEGITAYPKATLARACLLNALYLNKATDAEVVAVAKELSVIDPRSNTALKFVADAYRKGGADKSDSLVLTLVQMMQNDPKNATLQVEAVREIAGAKNPGIARPIIEKALEENPGDPDLMRLQWQILGAVKDYTKMIEVGSELSKIDTSFADTTYYYTTSNLLAADSQFQKAAEFAATGLKKYPTDAYLHGFEIQNLDKAGQTQQALDKLVAALGAKIAIPNGQAIRLSYLQKLNRPSSEVIAAAKEIIAAGDTTAAVRQIIFNDIQTQMGAAQKNVATDAVAAVDSLGSVLKQLDEAAPLAGNALQKGQVAFLKGFSNLTLAQVKAQQAQSGRNCQLAKDARAHATAAMTDLPAGAGFAPPATVQAAMGQAIQWDSNIGQLMASFPNCK
jgi:hypothetical protein